ncbi:hypothetical protein [Pseudomonas leptonychotis]|uniref:amino acid kinase family protein n=1 Tax=Pseudomonas leptonychotis TaxID=2448482 RepID=UPI0039EE9B75
MSNPAPGKSLLPLAHNYLPPDTLLLPVARNGEGKDLHGVEAVIDKDLCSSLLAREQHADVLVIATDVAAVYLDWGQPTQRPLCKVTPQELSEHTFAAGSMGPKVEAAQAFALATGRRAVIGSLEQIYAFVVCPKGSSNPGTESPGAQRNRK